MAEYSKKLHTTYGDMIAIIQGQHLEDSPTIQQHLCDCPQCQQRLFELSQTNRTLDVIGQMARDQRYPELSPERVLVYARHGIQKKIRGNIDPDSLLNQYIAYEIKKIKRSSFFAASSASLSLLIIVVGILIILIGNTLLGLTISATVGITGIFLFMFLNKVRKAYKQIDKLSKELQEEKVVSRNLSIDNEACE